MLVYDCADNQRIKTKTKLTPPEERCQSIVQLFLSFYPSLEELFVLSCALGFLRRSRIQATIDQREAHCNTYNDAIVRQMIECVKVREGGRLTIIFGAGYEIEEQV